MSPNMIRAIPVLLTLSGTVGIAAQMPGQNAPGPPPAQVEQTSHGIRATAGNEVLELVYRLGDPCRCHARTARSRLAAPVDARRTAILP